MDRPRIRTTDWEIWQPVLCSSLRSSFVASFSTIQDRYAEELAYFSSPPTTRRLDGIGTSDDATSANVSMRAAMIRFWLRDVFSRDHFPGGHVVLYLLTKLDGPLHRDHVTRDKKTMGKVNTNHE